MYSKHQHLNIIVYNDPWRDIVARNMKPYPRILEAEMIVMCLMDERENVTKEKP